jgi:hypothetical protein
MARMFRQLKFYNRDPSLKGPGIENLQMAAVPNETLLPDFLILISKLDSRRFVKN